MKLTPPFINRQTRQNNMYRQTDRLAALLVVLNDRGFVKEESHPSEWSDLGSSIFIMHQTTVINHSDFPLKGGRWTRFKRGSDFLSHLRRQLNANHLKSTGSRWLVGSLAQDGWNFQHSMTLILIRPNHRPYLTIRVPFAFCASKQGRSVAVRGIAWYMKPLLWVLYYANPLVQNMSSLLSWFRSNLASLSLASL